MFKRKNDMLSQWTLATKAVKQAEARSHFAETKVSQLTLTAKVIKKALHA